MTKNSGNIRIKPQEAKVKDAGIKQRKQALLHIKTQESITIKKRWSFILKITILLLCKNTYNSKH